MQTCDACATENPDGHRFCGSCGAALTAPAVERRKLVTSVFCDLSGSTAIGERVDAETVFELMRSYFDEARAALERHGGAVEKFIGDAVVGMFGVPEAHEDDALRACRAALEIQERIAALNVELTERSGRRSRCGSASTRARSSPATLRAARCSRPATRSCSATRSTSPPGSSRPRRRARS